MSWLADTVRPVRIAITTLALGLAACDHTVDFRTDAGRSAGGLDGSVSELDAEVDAGESEAGETDAGETDADLSLGEGGVALCGNHVCACANGEDDDNDLYADGLDSECTGAFDDDESSFRVNNVRTDKKCTDCFYDGNPGAGDDRCNVSSHCAEDGTPGTGGGNCKTCDALPACQERCLPVTPNGCDCFGCCEVNNAGTPVPIRLVATCNMNVIGRTELCPRCTINRSCFNVCEACDLCPGKTLADLPSVCMNAVACNERSHCSSSKDCKASQYCGQGCCLPILY